MAAAGGTARNWPVATPVSDEEEKKRGDLRAGYLFNAVLRIFRPAVSRSICPARMMMR
jgi:hypothetical protein